MSRLGKLLTVVKDVLDVPSSWQFISGLPPDDEGVMNDVYSGVELAYSCISYTAKAIAQVPLRLMKFSRTGSEPVPQNHPLQRIINRPNYMTNSILFLEGIIVNWLIDGNVCIVPYPTPAVPDSLWIARWKYMDYKIDTVTGHLLYWEYRPNGITAIKLKPEDVLHLKFHNPNEPIDGMAPSTAGRLPILEFYKSSRYNQAFFDSGAMPGGVLSSPNKVHNDVIEKTRAQWREKHQGYQKAHEIAILQQGLTYQAVVPSHKDMDFIELRKSDEDAIMRIYGMKKTILSKTENANYAISREERKEWWMGTCLPLMRMIADSLTFGLIRNNENLRYEFDTTVIEALHDDTDTAVKTMERLFRMSFTRNELNRRFHLGFDEKPWGNVAFVPVNMMPVNQGPIENPGQNVADSPDVDAPVNNMRRSLSEGLPNFFKLCNSESNRFMEKYRRFFFDMRSRCLKTFRNDGVEAILNINFDNEISRFHQTLNSELDCLIDNGRQFFSDSFDFELDNTSPFIISDESKDRFIRERKAVFTGVTAEVHRQVLELLQKESDKEKIDKGIRQIFNSADKEVKGLVKYEIQRVFDFASVNCLRAIEGPEKEGEKE
jgi:HK97 family phage portal protein